MAEEMKVETVEVAEPEVAAVEKLPTVEELKDGGFSSKELEMAEKHSMVAKPEEKKMEEKPPVAAEKNPEDGKEVPGQRQGALPDFTISDPAKEKVFLDTFGAGTPQRAMYFRMKNERQSRQRAEQALGEERKSREALEARLAALEKGGAAQDVDENGNAIDPADKPLTMRQLQEMEKKRGEEFQKAEQEKRERANAVISAQRDQEEYARAAFPDFDDAAKKAAEVMQNIETLFPEKWKQDKVVRLVRDLQIAAANAHTLGVDDYNAAMIAYELGQMHPEFGKSNGEVPILRETLKDPKANGSHTPGDTMKRIEENTQRRASSASIPGGGGRRTITADEVSAEDLNRMTSAERWKFREKHPDRYNKLLRG